MRIKLLLTVITCLIMAASPVHAQKKMGNIFYAQNTLYGFKNAPQTALEKAKLLKTIGFDGLEGFGYQDFPELKKALDQQGLGMPVNYVELNFEEDGKLERSSADEIKAMIRVSEKGAVIYFHLHSERYKDDKDAGDPVVVNILRELSDFSAPFGVRLCVYPHASFYCETLAHSVTLAKMVDRKNYGAAMNLCHLLKVEGSEGIPGKIKEAAPFLFAVNICGADDGDTRQLGWDRLIQPLGEGSFDTYRFVKSLIDNGYTGPIGLQCYNLQGDAFETLTRSMETWKGYQKRYSEQQPLPKHNLTVNSFATRSNESFPLGNGLIGAMIWQKGNMLRMSLDRADLWDLRPTKDIDKLTFKMVTDHVNRGDYSLIQQLGDVPYVRDPAPSKIRGAALMFDVSKLGELDHSTLDIASATCSARWKNGATFETFVHATKPVGWFRFQNIPDNFIPVLEAPVYQGETAKGGTGAGAIQGLATLGYKQGTVQTEGNKIIYDQEAWGGMTYQVSVQWIRVPGGIEGAWSISTKFPDAKNTGESAGQVVTQALAEGMKSDAKTHLAWWENFWQKSSISIPDEPDMEQLWYLEQYKFGSGSRQGAPPISLVAVWADDNGSLPPWKGDYHNDINTQYSYWPAYSSNHLSEEMSFIDWMWDLRPQFRQFTKQFFGVDGLNAPGVCTLDGSPMGGWIQYAMGPTVSAWLAHHFYLHWRYSMDREFLRTRAYPWFKEVIGYLDNLTIIEKGVRKLPLSSSPEYNDNRIDAWFKQTSNFDLALIRWTYNKGAELAGELGLTEEQKKWKQIENEWPPFDLDESGGLSIAPNLPLSEQHRHHSHMLAIQPLGYIDMANGEKDQKIIKATLALIEKMGPPEWPGWTSNFYSRALDGEKAHDYLRKHIELNCENLADGTKNLFIQKYTYFFASSLQDMLLQSHNGTIQVFPAIPGSWQNCSFRMLRAEGAFLISAERKNGKTTNVEIYSESGGKLRIKNPFGPSYLPKGATTNADHSILEFICKPNSNIELYEK